MTARLWTALLLLAAVLAAHGVQCTAAAADPVLPHAATHPPQLEITVLGPAGHGTAATGTGDTAANAAHLATARTGPALGLAATVSPGTGHGPAHDTAAHLWTLCRAVLAAGLAVLLTLLLPRALTLLRPTGARLRWHLPAGLAPPRPPHLHVLCLLRT